MTGIWKRREIRVEENEYGYPLIKKGMYLTKGGEGKSAGRGSAGTRLTRDSSFFFQ